LEVTTILLARSSTRVSATALAFVFREANPEPSPPSVPTFSIFRGTGLRPLLLPRYKPMPTAPGFLRGDVLCAAFCSAISSLTRILTRVDLGIGEGSSNLCDDDDDDGDGDGDERADGDGPSSESLARFRDFGSPVPVPPNRRFVLDVVAVVVAPTSSAVIGTDDAMTACWLSFSFFDCGCRSNMIKEEYVRIDA
jgi:hypothetical protein